MPGLIWVLGCLYLISMYYRRYELQKRFTLFFCSTVISGAFGGVSAPISKINVDESVIDPVLTLFSTIAFCVCDSKNVRRRRLWRMALDFHCRGSYHHHRRPRLLFFHCRLAWEGKVPQRPGASSAASPNTWGWSRSDNGSFWQEIRSPRFWWLENLHRVRNTSLATLYIEKNPWVRKSSLLR